MGATLIRGVLLAAILVVALVPTPAFGHTTRGNREVRIDRGIGPIDVGDTHREVVRVLGHRGRKSRVGAIVTVDHGVAGGDLSLFYDVGKRGRLRPGSRVMMVNTFSSRFRLPDGTSTETGFDAAHAALGPRRWGSLDCRTEYGFAYIWHRGRRATTTLSYFEAPAATILSVGIKVAPIEPPCSDHVFYGDFARP